MTIVADETYTHTPNWLRLNQPWIKRSWTKRNISLSYDVQSSSEMHIQMKPFNENRYSNRAEWIRNFNNNKKWYKIESEATSLHNNAIWIGRNCIFLISQPTGQFSSYFSPFPVDFFSSVFFLKIPLHPVNLRSKYDAQLAFIFSYLVSIQYYYFFFRFFLYSSCCQN